MFPEQQQKFDVQVAIAVMQLLGHSDKLTESESKLYQKAVDFLANMEE